MNAGVIYSLL